MVRLDPDHMDRDLLNLIQEDFPLSSRPYLELARILQVSEEEILQRLQVLKDSGLIRRIGAVFDSKKMGYYSTLCACKVPEDRIDQVAAIVSREPGVTHNYQRDHDFNLWFTLTAPDREAAGRIIRQLEHEAGVKIECMPTTRVYKIKVSFEIGGTDVL